MRKGECSIRYVRDINDGKSKLYTLLLILLPVLKQYVFLSMSFMDVFNIFAFVYFFVNRGNLNVRNIFVPYILYTLIFMMFAMLNLSVYSPSLIFKNILSFTLLTFNMFFIAPYYFDLEYGFKWYKNVVLISGILSIIQTLINALFSYRLILVFPWLTLNYGDRISGSSFINAVQGYYSYRASAFFLEAAYFAEFCLPFLFLSLFNVDSKLTTKNIVRSLFVTLAICLSASMLGIVGCLIAWIFYLCKLLWTSKRRKLIVLIPLVVGFGIYIYNLDIVQMQVMSKMHSTEDLARTSSLSLRLLRGWYCFGQLDSFHQIVGVGYSCVGAFFTEYNITTVVDAKGLANSYMNGISLMFCSLGIFGTLLYLVPFIKIILQSGKVFMLSICWIVLMFTAQIFDTACYVVLVVFIIQISKEKHDNGCIVDCSIDNIS